MSLRNLRDAFKLYSECDYCGGDHEGACPYVSSIEYHPNGNRKRVVFNQRPLKVIGREEPKCPEQVESK